MRTKANLKCKKSGCNWRVILMLFLLLLFPSVFCVINRASLFKKQKQKNFEVFHGWVMWPTKYLLIFLVSVSKANISRYGLPADIGSSDITRIKASCLSCFSLQRLSLRNDGNICTSRFPELIFFFKNLLSLQ